MKILRIALYFWTLCSVLILVTACTPSGPGHDSNARETLISKDGNLLFYNAPVAAKFHDTIFTAFVNRRGGVLVRKFERQDARLDLIREYAVHDYQDMINHERGMADDHAAPAIIHDAQNDRLILATSYHGTDMYIYEYHAEQDGFTLLTIMQGRYTYPRLIKWHGDVYLFARLQQQAIKASHLVVRSSRDDFESEEVVIPSVDGEVIYASRPALGNDGIYFTYSTHRYDTKRMHGWMVISYNPNKHQIIEEYDLSYLLDQGYYSNRPTDIGYKNGRLLVGTAFFQTEQKVDSRFYSRSNTVLIAEKDLGTKDRFGVVERNTAYAPYYHSSVSIDEDLNWIFFDKDKVRSSIKFKDGCFNHDNMMYPNLTEHGVYYAVVNNGYYEIRNFDNSVVRCNQ